VGSFIILDYIPNIDVFLGSNSLACMYSWVLILQELFGALGQPSSKLQSCGSRQAEFQERPLSFWGVLMIRTR
jgi:hypothetical protein